MAKIIFTENEIKDIVNKYNIEGYTIQQIADVYQRNRKTISRVLHDNNVTIKYSTKNRKLNIDYFKTIDSEEKAYILGFLVADGNVYISDKDMKVSFSQTAKDVDILYKIKNILQIDAELFYSPKENTYNLYVYSKPMVEDLLKLDVMPRKSHEKIKFFPKQLDHHLYIPYIRGFVDGDGGFSKRTNSKLGYVFSITALNKSLLTDVIEVINPIIDAKNTLCAQHNGCWRADWNWQEDIYKIAKLLYSDSSIHLDRKFKIAQEIISKVEDIV